MSRSARTRPGFRLIAATALGLTALTAFAAPASADVPPERQGTIPGAWIVTLDEGADPRGVSAEHARQHAAQVDHVYQYALRGYAARMSDQAAARVAQDPRVASVERDQVVTAFAPPSKDATTTAVAQTVPTGIARIDGGTSSAIAGDGSGVVDVDVAVLDTGIAAHSDLDVKYGKNCTSGKKTINDGHGHGTHVAGTIGARDDGTGVVGVAPGARLWAVKVLSDQGSGSRSQIICGVDWVTQNRSTIEVVNMSLGGAGTEPAGAGCSTGDSYHDAICRSVGFGVTYVVAAGNSSVDAKGSVPAAYDEVITVSALADSDGAAGGSWPTDACRPDQEDTLADFSNYGADVDLIAPGVCINSTWKGGGYTTISGTSMASPHVAGAAALYLSKPENAGKAPDLVKAALIAGGNDVWDNTEDPDGVQERLLNVAGF